MRLIDVFCARRAQAEPKSDLQVEQEEQMNNILLRARRAREEDHDDAKKMNSIILYAKCATIREAQLEEKERLKREAEMADKLADQMMDIERYVWGEWGWGSDMCVRVCALGCRSPGD